jgi:hypothetical protein
VTIADPTEFGLSNVEGAVLTGERHILTDRAREFFEQGFPGDHPGSCHAPRI